MTAKFLKKGTNRCLDRPLGAASFKADPHQRQEPCLVVIFGDKTRRNKTRQEIFYYPHLCLSCLINLSACRNFSCRSTFCDKKILRDVHFSCRFFGDKKKISDFSSFCDLRVSSRTFYPIIYRDKTFLVLLILSTGIQTDYSQFNRKKFK